MPAFGRDGILEPTHIADAVSHVRVISRPEKPSVSSARGAALFEVNCAVCHGPEGAGGREAGAPKLTDAHRPHVGRASARDRLCQHVETLGFAEPVKKKNN